MRALCCSLHQALLKGQILRTAALLFLLSNKGGNLSRFLILFEAIATSRRVNMLGGRRRLHREPSGVTRHHHILIRPVASCMVMVVISRRTMLPKR